MKKIVTVIFTAGIVVMLPLSVVGASATKSHLLSLSDLPTGWSVTHQQSTSTGGIAGSHCFSALKHGKQDKNTAIATFKNNGTTLGELLTTGRGSVKHLHLLNHALRTCSGATFTATGKTVHMTIGQMSFPKLARTSVAFSLTIHATGLTAGGDIVTFRVGSYVGWLLDGSDIGSPFITTFLTLAKKAVAKAR